MNDLLNVNSLSAGYGRRTVLKDVSFSVREGEICAVLGENGSGKTTLLRALGILLPSEGALVLDGRDIRRMDVRTRAQNIGYLSAGNGPELSVSCLETVLMGYYPLTGAFRPITREQREAASRVFSLLDIAGFEERDFRTLSGGEKQLVLFVRTLLRPVRMLLLDEPEDALDFRRRRAVLEILRKRAKETGGCVLLCMHDVNAALRCADRILTLKDGGIAADLALAELGEAELRRALSEIYGRIDLIRRGDTWIMAEGA